MLGLSFLEEATRNWDQLLRAMEGHMGASSSILSSPSSSSLPFPLSFPQRSCSLIV